MIHSFSQKNHSKKIATVLMGLLVLVALFLRFWKLDQIPLSFYHDEMDYVFTGEAVARYGTDITGKWSPWGLQPLKTLNITAELTAGIHGFIQTLFGIGVENGRLPNALFGVGTIIAVGLLAHAIFKNTPHTFSVMLVLALNPWHVYISRTGYEAPIGLFFQCVFLVCLWKLTEFRNTHRKKVHSVLLLLCLFGSMFFGYFTYHGLKFSLVLMSLAGSLWILFSGISKTWKFSIILGMLTLMSAMLSRTLEQNRTGMLGNRQSELIFSSEFLTKIVNEQRRISIDTPVDALVSNKATILGEAFIKRYLSVFDFYRFFISGYESGFQFSLIVHGFFYLSGVPLLILGLIYLKQKKSQALLFLLLFLFVSPFVTAIQIGTQSLFRSALTYVILNIFIGCGIANIIEWSSRRKQNLYVSALIVLCLCIEVFYFGYKYFSEYPLRSTENQYFFEKVLAGYVNHTSQPVLVITKPDAFSRARAVVSYLHLMPQLNMNERQQFFTPLPATFKIRNITLTQDCPDVSTFANTVQLIDPGKFQECKYDVYLATASATVQKNKKIFLKSLGSPLDGGTYFYMLNDSVCSNTQLRDYAYASTFNQLNVLSLSPSEFCSTWVKNDSVDIR